MRDARGLARGGRRVADRACGRDRRHRRRRRQRPERTAGGARRHAADRGRRASRSEGAPSAAQERDPHALRRRGLLHVPEDRLRMGLVPSFEACESAMLGFHDERATGPGVLLDRSRDRATRAGRRWRHYDVRPRAPHAEDLQVLRRQPAEDRAGARDRARPKVLLVGQPTRGVDIGAIEFIHRRLDRAARRGRRDPAGLGGAGGDHGPGGPDRGDVRRAASPASGCAGRTDERDLGLLMAGVTDRAA